MSLAKSYLKSVWKQRSMNALYPPDGSVRLGDVLEYKNGSYRHRDTLNGLGILSEVSRPLGRPRTDKIPTWGVMSESGVKVHTKVRGKLIPGVTLSTLKDTEAGAVVTMKEENSYLLSLSDVTHKAYASISQLGGPISRRFWRNRWDTSWIIVTEVWIPRHCSFLASSTGDSQFELKAKTGAKKAGLGNVDLGGKFSLASHSRSQDHFVDNNDTVPLFRGYRWALALRPAGRRLALSRAVDAATTASLGVDSHSLFESELAPVPFDPTAD